MSRGKPEIEVSYLFPPLMETPERYFPMMLEKTLAEPSNVYDLTYGFLGTAVGSLNAETWKWVMLGDRLLQKWSPRRTYRAPILAKLASLNNAQIVPTLEWLCRSRREPLENRLRAAELLLPFNANLALQTLSYWCHRSDVQAILKEYEAKHQLFGALLQVFSTALSHKDRPWVHDWQMQVELLQSLVGEPLEAWCVEAMEAAIERFRFPTDIEKRCLDHKAAFSTIRWLGELQSDALIEQYLAILRRDRDEEEKHRSCFSFYVCSALRQYPLDKIEALLRGTLRGDYPLDYASFNWAIAIIEQRQWHQHFQADLLVAGHRCLNLPMPGPMLPTVRVLDALEPVNPVGFFELLEQSLQSSDSQLKTKAIQCLARLYPQRSIPAFLAFLLEIPTWLYELWSVEDEDLRWHDYAEARLRNWDAPILAHLATVDDRSVGPVLQDYLQRLKPEVHLLQWRPRNVRDLERNKRMLIYELLDYFCQQPQPEFTPYFVSLLPNLEELLAGLAEERSEELERRMMPRERLLEKLVEVLGNIGDERAILPLQSLLIQSKNLRVANLEIPIEQALLKIQSIE